MQKTVGRCWVGSNEYYSAIISHFFVWIRVNERRLIPKKNVRRRVAEIEQKPSRVLCGLIWDKVERGLDFK